MTYPKSASLMGYATAWLTNGIFRKINNGFVSGSQNYGAGSPSAEVLTITFSGAPADGTSGLAVPDGINGSGTPTTNFTYHWAGAPGAGLIPLVGGGGTAAQAATATQVALAAQLNNWTVTNPSSGVVKMVMKQKGFNISAAAIAGFLTGVTNAVLVATGRTFGLVIPGRFGKNYCTLPA